MSRSDDHHPRSLRLSPGAIKSIYVIVPAYNEQRVIGDSLSSLIALGYTVVVVDDNSRDLTWPILKTLPVHALRHPINLGQGAALQTGMTYALKKGAEFIVHFDADGQHRAEDIETLIAPLLQGDADVALGSRFLRKGDSSTMPASRKFLLKAGVIVNGLLTGVWLSDAHNGFRAFTRTAAGMIQLHENRYAHASEIINQIRQHKLRWVEVPTNVVYTEYAMEKGQSPWNAIKIVMDIALRRVFK